MYDLAHAFVFDDLFPCCCKPKKVHFYFATPTRGQRSLSILFSPNIIFLGVLESRTIEFSSVALIDHPPLGRSVKTSQPKETFHSQSSFSRTMASTIPIEPVNGVTHAEDKSLNLDSLKEHMSRESLWMLLHDKVYDVTKFMDEVGDLCLCRVWGGKRRELTR